MKPPPTWRGTARDTAVSSTDRTAFCSICCNLSRTNDPIKISRLTLQNNSGRPRRLSVTAYAEWVSGQLAQRIGSLHHHGTRSADRRPLCEKRVERRIRRTHRFCGSRRTANFLHRRPHRISRPQWRAGTPGSAGTQAARFPESGRGPRSLRGAANHYRIAARRASRKSCFFLGQAENKNKRPELLNRYRAANLDDTPERGNAQLGRHARRGAGHDARSEHGPAAESLAAVSNAELPRLGARRVLSVERRVRIPRSTSGCDGACRRRSEVSRANICCARPRASLSKATSSTGGIRRPDAAYARESPTIFCGCPTPSSISSKPPATWPSSRKRCRFSKAICWPKGKTNPTSSRAFRKPARTLFEHCARALDRSLAVGAHGLPLMGTGDWNDGMNRVGQDGKGESVWLGWFLHTVLWEFAKIADARGERKRAETWRLHVSALKAALERDGWDGEWYRRAYFDDGTPLGSVTKSECRIDSIAQSWGVISGAAERGRGARAMAAVDQATRAAAGRLDSAFHAALRSHCRAIPATSKAMFPAFAKTAASIRTPRSGR